MDRPRSRALRLYYDLVRKSSTGHSEEAAYSTLISLSLGLTGDSDTKDIVR